VYVSEPQGVKESTRLRFALELAVAILESVCARAVATGSGAAGAEGELMLIRVLL
jgi:hypothetical protein